MVLVVWSAGLAVVALSVHGGAFTAGCVRCVDAVVKCHSPLLLTPSLYGGVSAEG